MDYRRFLGKQEELVLPYFGGPEVESPGRRLAITEEVEPGWWRFLVKGRRATALVPAEPQGLGQQPRVLGHLIGARLVSPGALVEPLEFVPEDEPPLFSPVSARRWTAERLLFEQLEFEGEAEEAVRQALEERRSLADVKGASAALRAAYVFALLDAVGRAEGVQLEPLELRHKIVELAAGGWQVAQDEARRVREHREAYARRQRLVEEGLLPASAREWRRPLGPGVQGSDSQAASLERAEAALRAAGARLLRSRRLAGGAQLEVVYRFLGTRFVSIVDARTLQVIDSGICLEGSDSSLTLASLPGAIREATETGALYIMRHVSDD